MTWEYFTSGTFRMKVHGGWLVKTTDNGSTAMCFVPDAQHVWIVR